MASADKKSPPVVLISLCCVGLVGFTISSIVILSLITLYLPDKGSNLNSTARALSFGKMLSQSTGYGLSYIEDDFLNSDSFNDLIVANFNGDTISVSLGLGNGSFGSPVLYSTGIGSAPNAVVIGDINKDSHKDIIVANSGTSNVGLFLGKGDGTFAAQTTYSTGTSSSPYGVAVGDLNRDNILDVVASDNTNDNVVVFLGATTGTLLTLTRTLSTGSGSKPYGVVINDFNGDGQPDIGVSNSGTNNVGIFLNTGSTNFGGQTTYSTGSYPATIIAVDLNKDGILDITTSNYKSDSVSVLLGNRDGTFQTQKVYSTGSGSLPYSVYYGDFNRDSNQDLIVANSGTNNIGILLGNGRGDFQLSKTYSTGDGSSPVDITVADYNHDGRLDFISANDKKNSTRVFLNTSI